MKSAIRACGALLFLAACAAPAPRTAEPSLRAAPTAKTKVEAVPPPAEACIAPSLREELTCAPGGPTVAAWTWPDPKHLFHYPERALWQSPVMPAALTAEAAAQEPRLAAAEKQLASASWKAAHESFSAFLRATPPDHVLRGVALARDAKAAANLGQFDVAVDDLFALLTFVHQRPTAAFAATLEALARRDLVTFYPRSTRRPEDLAALLRATGIDPSSVTAVVDTIADGYVDASRYDAANATLAELASRENGAKRCTYGARQLAVSIVREPANRKRLLDLATEQSRLQRQLAPKGASGTDEEACREATVAVIGELAIAWHVEAVGRPGIPGTGDVRTLRAVESLYELLDENVAADDLGESSLSWIAPANRPTRFRVRFARAEIARFAKDWEKCGPAFARAEAVAPTEPLRTAAMAKATGCYLESVVERTKRPKAGAAIPLGEPEKKLLDWGARYLCTDASNDHDDMRTDVELARGRALYLAHDWKRAAAALERLAFVGGQAQSRRAAAMYLVAIHRAGCAQQLEVDRARLVALHCAAADEDDADGPSILGVTVSEERRVTPCEAMRAVAAPPPPLPVPPPKPLRQRVWIDSTMVSGAVVPEYVAWVSSRHVGAWQACYDLALARDPFAEGAAWLSFEIARDGSVARPDAGSSDMDVELQACVRRVVAGLSFSQPEGGTWYVRWDLELSRTRGAHLVRQPVIMPTERSK